MGRYLAGLVGVVVVVGLFVLPAGLGVVGLLGYLLEVLR
jgi:hypothetical protein